MLVSLSHRGPEAIDMASYTQAALGRTLLGFNAIGHNPQPLASDDGRCAIVFNGEIYNQKELRRDLGRDGYRCANDTEIILSLYLRDELAFPQRLRGMFAVAILDFWSDSIILARDPFGKKPLQYFSHPSGFVFASELSALLQHPACPREVDDESLRRYLVFNAAPSPRSMLRGIRKVSPGSLVVAKRGEVTERQYWRLPNTRESAATLPEWEEIFEDRLRAAVRERLLTSDTPIGTFLSGGLDSATVTALACKVGTGKVSSFSLAFEDETYDESPYAERVARHCGAEHHVVRVNERDLADVVINRLKEIDEPVADPALVPYIRLCSFARQSVKGVLSGDGADEMLLGYRIFEIVRLISFVERYAPEALLKAALALINGLPVSHANMNVALILKLLARGMGAPPELRWYESTAGFNSAELVELIPSSASAGPGGADVYDDLRRFVAEYEPEDTLSRVQLGMICHYLRDLILSRVDRGSMLNSLEVRCPFLDTELVGLMMSMPTDLKMRGLRGKWILKRLAAKHLPRDIVERRKQGFRAPVARMLCGELREFALDTLSPGAVKRHGLFDHAVVGRLLDEHLNGRADNQKQLWSLLCFHIWLNQVSSVSLGQSAEDAGDFEFAHSAAGVGQCA
jgi:asparagine synthase (glutamine-hydrolysing)